MVVHRGERRDGIWEVDRSAVVVVLVVVGVMKVRRARSNCGDGGCMSNTAVVALAS